MQITEKMREFDDDKQELVLTMVASVEDVDASSKKFFAEIAKRDHKGFRKGKAPRKVLEQSVGGHEAAMGGVAEQLVNDLARKTIDDEDIIFIDEPQFNVDNNLEEGKPFTFTVSGPIAPDMKLVDYGPVDIELPPEEATEAEIDSHLEGLREYYHSFKDIEDPDHEAAMGDYVMMVLTVTDSNDKVVGGLSATSRMIGLGTGTMPESFDSHIVGAKAGETREFDFEAIKEDGTSDFGDGNLHAVVDIKSIREMVLPELDDELAIKVGCMDAEDMRKQMQRNINIQKKKEIPKIKIDRVVEEATKRLDGEVPAYYVDFIRQDVGREFMKSLEDQGTNLQQYMLQNSIDGDLMKEEIEMEARHRAAIDCTLEAIFKEKGLEVTDEDIDALFEGDEGADSRKAWEDACRMADVRKIIRQNKATDWLVQTANVKTVDYAELAAEADKQAKEKASKAEKKKTAKKSKKASDDVLEISFGEDTVKMDIDG